MPSSKVVALAGAGGHLARHIAEGLVASGKFTVVCLVRTPNDALQSSLGALAPEPNKLKMEAVDYASEQGLVDVFKKYSVDTVISAISISTVDARGGSLDAQNALLHASQAAGVRRFSPCNYAIPIDENVRTAEAYKARRGILPALRASGLEWASFNCGLWLNLLSCFAPPKPDGSKAIGYVKEMPFALNIAQGELNIVGTGSTVNILTSVSDVGKFVAGACALERAWDPETTSYMEGDRASFDDVVAIAEKITGRKITRKVQSLEDAYATVKRVTEAGEYYPVGFITECLIIGTEEGLQTSHQPKDNLNTQLEKEGLMFKTDTVEGFLTYWWGGQ